MAQPEFEVSLAGDAADLRAVQRLRYEVFVRELGGGGDMVDHGAGLEADRFDDFADHLILRDMARDEGDRVVGVYRLMSREQAARAGGFYSAGEYDLTPLEQSGRALLELGRSCLHAQYRGGAAMYHLWNALAGMVETRGVEILFGTASFHGTDVAALAPALSLLHHRHLAPEAIRARARVFQPMDLIAPADLDRRQAMLQVPALIKAYLRLGGVVGEGAFVDHDFNTTDVCLIMDATRMSATQRNIYSRGGRA